MSLPPLPADYAASRADLHAVAEQVLAAARFAAVGRIALAPLPGGFGTPGFPGPGGVDRVVRVDGVELVVDDDGIESLRQPLTTVGDLAAALDVDLAAPVGSFTPTTPREPGRPLAVSPAAAAVVEAWLALAVGVLDVLADDFGSRGEVLHAPALWPEHFDAGMDAGPEGAQASYGLSPGDDGEPAPYAYVSAWQALGDDPFWNASSFRGAVLRYDDVATADDPGAAVLDFLRRGRVLLGG